MPVRDWAMTMINDETAPLTLTPEEIAEITEGSWVGPPLKQPLDLVTTSRAECRSGALLVTTNREQWRDRKAFTESMPKLQEVARKGAAIVLRRGAGLKIPTSILEVANTRHALTAIARGVRRKAQAKRILVTGTEGKTGFKAMFTHVASRQMGVSARIDSKNRFRGVCTSLANIKAHHRFAVIEVAVPRRGVGERRSRLIKPHMCVITEIGYEHLAKHGSIDALINNKASVVSSLRRGGICIVRSSPRYFEQLYKAIRAYGKGSVATFGDRDSDDGRLLDASFDPDRAGWRVWAAVDGQALEYFLPVPERYVPLSSVAVLLATSRMGLDVHRAAGDLAEYQPTPTSGRLYTLPVNAGVCHVYDHSLRTYLLGIEDFFHTLSALSAPDERRRIIVLGHVYDETEYGPIVHELLPKQRLRTLVEGAYPDLLITVGKAGEFTDVFAGMGSRWRELASPEQAVTHLTRILQADDLLAINGDTNERMQLIPERLREWSAGNRYSAVAGVGVPVG